MAKSKKTFKKYLIEALLIIFSVLLALMLNKAYDSYQIRKQKEVARQSIVKELSKNAAIIHAMYDNHQNIKARLTSLVDHKNDSLRNELLAYEYFNHWIVTDQKSIAPEFVSNTAWETARSTGIIAEFDYAEVEKLTRIYTMQDVIFKGTLASILEFLFQRETHDLRNLDSSLLQLKLRFTEITDQEYYLKTLYDDWNKDLK
jgi:hypothetical protein